jgi:P4 family phage/plasmid primase-like protien
MTYINKSSTFKFLKSFQIQDKRMPNLTSMESPYGKYNIPTDAVNLKTLAKAISQDNEHGFYPALVEQHDRMSDNAMEHVYFDYDIEVKTKISSDKWCELVNTLAFITQDVVDSCVKNKAHPDSQINNQLHVLYRNNVSYEKQNDENETVFKYGLHLVYPEITMSRVNRKLLYGKIIRKLEEQTPFQECDIVGGNQQSMTKILDESVLDKSGIMLYGCSKKNREPYTLQKIFDAEMNELPIDKSVDNYQEQMILKMLCCLSTNDSDDESVYEVMIDTEELNDLKLTFNITDKIPTTVKHTIDCGKRNMSDNDRTMLVQQARKLLSMLTTNSYGSGSYDRWKTMIISCANIGGEKLRRDCHLISAKSPTNYNKHELDNFYSSAMSKNYPNWIQSLRKLAKEDNPDEFNKYMDERRKASLEDSEEASTYKLAKAAKELIGEYFVSTDSQTSGAIWYFNKYKHRWTNKRGYDELSIYLSEDFCKVYEDRVAKLEESLDKESTDKERTLTRVAHIRKNIIEKLRNVSFKSLLIKELCVLISDEEFEDNLDSNAHLIGFNNGVFDLDRQIFRDGHPSDLISLGTNIDYQPYDPNDPMTAKIFKVLEDIHPTRENREYWLKTMACALHGRRTQQSLYMWIGSGSNGKSTLIDLTQKAFGDLMDTPHVSLLTKPIQNNGGPNPLIVGLKGKRLVIFLEPEHTDRISSSFMKQLFGGDTLKARTLHAKHYVSFRSQMMGIVSCNDLPHVQSNDFGTWRRIRTIPHPTEFTANPVKPHQRMIDTSVDDDLEKMAEPFMGILLDYYAKYIHSYNPAEKFKRFSEPDDVTKGTREYQTDCDFYADFVNDSYKETGVETDIIDSKDAYVDFQDWYQQTNPGKKPPEWKQFRKNVAKKLNASVNSSKWNGWVKKSYIDLDNDSSTKANVNSNNNGPSF